MGVVGEREMFARGIACIVLLWRNDWSSAKWTITIKIESLTFLLPRMKKKRNYMESLKYYEPSM
jgi:hypothetical protein